MILGVVTVNADVGFKKETRSLLLSLAFVYELLSLVVPQRRSSLLQSTLETCASHFLDVWGVRVWVCLFVLDDLRQAMSQSLDMSVGVFIYWGPLDEEKRMGVL